MRVVCRYNRGSQLADHQRGRMSDFDEEFYITVGQTYIVLGMGIFETRFCFLICDDSRGPGFYPAGLFEPFEHELPPDWHFGLRPAVAYSGRDLWTQCVAIWGYEELVHDPDHGGALGERDEAALMIFFHELIRREQELEEESDE